MMNSGDSDLPASARMIAPLFALLGLVVLYIAIARPAALWDLTRLRGMRAALGETGTSVLLALVGLANLAFAIFVFLRAKA